MAVTKTDKIFVVGLTLAMVVGFVVIAVRSVEFWQDIPGKLDPAGRVPMALGITGMLILGAIIVGMYFRGRRQELDEAEAEERAAKGGPEPPS